MPITEQELVELRRSYKRFALTDEGKDILKDLMIFCNYNKTSVCEHAPDALQTMFAEGKRRVILRINSFINFKEQENE